MSEKKQIPIKKLEYDPSNVRGEPNLDPEFIDSIRDEGVIHSLVVRPRSDGKYGVVAGKRRLLAAKKAGLDELPCVVREDLVDDDKRARRVSFKENLKREDLPVAKKKEMVMLEYGDTDGRKEKSKRAKEVANRLNVTARTALKYINISEKLSPTLNVRVKEPSERSEEEIERLEEFVSENYEALPNEAESSNLEKEKAKGFPSLKRIPVDVGKQLANSDFFVEFQEKDPKKTHKIATEAVEVGRNKASKVIDGWRKEVKKPESEEEKTTNWPSKPETMTIEVTVSQVLIDGLNKMVENHKGLHNSSEAATIAIRNYLVEEDLVQL